MNSSLSTLYGEGEILQQVRSRALEKNQDIRMKESTQQVAVFCQNKEERNERF